jgi:hypothetical protein
MLRRFQLAAFVVALTLGFAVVAMAETVEPTGVAALDGTAIEGAVCAPETITEDAQLTFWGSPCENECFAAFQACYAYCEPRGCVDTCWAQASQCVQVCP